MFLTWNSSMMKILYTYLMIRYSVFVISFHLLQKLPAEKNSFGKSLQFGESAPTLLEDYSVPHLFQEDFFDILDYDQRPAFRWLIIGPERSGASWHVDPGLTSAWNTLLCGRKRLESLLVLSVLNVT